MPHDGVGQRQAGFTLLEVLVSLVLLSLLLSVLFAGSRSLQRSWTALRDRDSRGQTDTVALTVSNWLAQAVGSLEPDREGILRGTFKGRPDRIDFVTLGQGQALPAGLVRVSIELRPTGTSMNLAVEYSLFRAEGTAPPVKAGVLLDPVNAIKIRYFGRDGPNQDPRWHNDWLDRTNLPLLVSLEITGAADERGSIVTALELASS